MKGSFHPKLHKRLRNRLHYLNKRLRHLQMSKAKRELKPTVFGLV